MMMKMLCQEISIADGFFVLHFNVSGYDNIPEYVAGTVGVQINGTIVDSYQREEDQLTVVTKLQTDRGLIEVNKLYDLSLSEVV